MVNQTTFKCQFGYNLQNLPHSYNTPLACLLIVTAMTSGSFNFLVILSIWKTPALHKPSYILVANLALADFLSGIVGELMLAFNYILIRKNQDGQWTSYVCAMLILSKAIAYLFCGVSISILVAMSVDRLLAITLKTRYKNNKLVKKCFKVYLVVSWAGLVGFAVSGSFDVAQQNPRRVFLAIFTVFAIIVSTIVICYSSAFCILRRSATTVTPNNANEGRLSLEKYRKVLNTFVIAGVFLLTCYTPFLIASFFVALYGLEETSARTVRLTICIAMSELFMYLSATVNPLLYSWRMKELKKAVKTVIKERLHGNCFSTLETADDSSEN